MSSLGSAQTPNYQFVTTDVHRALEPFTVSLYGSFQGFTNAAAGSPSATNYLPQQSRGAWFTVQRVNTGVYRVFLQFSPNATVQPRGVADGSQFPGNPTGMLNEPRCNIVNESAQTAPATTVAARASKVDKATPGNSTYNTFDIFTYNSAGSLTDVPTTERVQFELVFQNTTFGF